MRKKFLILGLIICLAFFLRFYKLGSVPPSPSLDEVSIGWNAYSISETGKDEYGTKLPILLRAYDDWRPALYVYLVIPFIKIFGLNVIAVRLPAVLLSLVTVLATYFLVKELLKNSQFSNSLTNLIALTASFLMSISPWHIYISRLGHEVNPGLAFSVLAVLFFLKYTNVEKGKSLFLGISMLFFALSFYTYQSQKVFGPLIILLLALIYKQQLVRDKVRVFTFCVFGFLLLIPVILASFTPTAMLRFKATSIFASDSGLLKRSASRIVQDQQSGNLPGLIFDNRRLAMGLTVAQSYFTHFNPSWLFFNSGEEKHKIPNMGLFYLWELPLLLVGLYGVTKTNLPKTSKLLLFGWLVIAPLPASITTEAPHAMRAFNMLPVPQIIAAIGAVEIFKQLKRSVTVLLLLAVMVFVSILFMFHNYFVNFPFEQSESFQYSLSRAISYVQGVENRYQKIVFSNKDSLYQSYMFFLFFNQYDPRLYLSQGGTLSGGFNETHQIGKYEFRPIEWEKKSKDNTLFVGNINEFPESVVSSNDIASFNGDPSIKIVGIVK